MDYLQKKLRYLNILHIFNDGFLISLPLLLPFVSKELDIDIAEVGILSSILTLLNVLLALPSGYISEKFGGLRILIIAVFVYSIGYLMIPFGYSFHYFAIAFLIAGLGFGIFHPIAFALVAKAAQPSLRGRTMGNFTAIGDVGRIGISTLVTVIAVYVGWRLTSLLYGLIALAVFVIFMFLNIKLRQGKKVSATKKAKSSFEIMTFLKHKELVLITLSCAIDTLASSTLFVFLPFLLLYRGIDPKMIGLFTGAFFVGNLVGKTTLGRFADRFGSFRTFVFSELFMGLSVFLLGNSHSFSFIMIFSVILGALSKGTVPVVQTMFIETIPHPDAYKKAFSFNSFIASIAVTGSSTLFGLISKEYGIVNAFNASAVIAALAIIPALVARKVKPAL